MAKKNNTANESTVQTLASDDVKKFLDYDGLKEAVSKFKETVSSINDTISGKQDKLTAGDNITIDSNNKISASASTSDIDAQSEDDVLNLSSSTSSGKTTITGSINQTLLKYINKPIGETGDILFYDSTADRNYIISFSEWMTNKSNYSTSRFEPIGIVVIPASHDVYGTGECGIMSLKHMRRDDPDNGGDEATMCWGYSSKLINTAYTAIVHNGDTNNPSTDGEVTGTTTSSVYLPTDFGAGVMYAKNHNSRYYYYNSSYLAGISPYLTDGSRNPSYYQTSSPSSTSNLFAYFNGVDLSSSILNNATGQSDWKTDSTITNSASSGYYPAACCCWRYHTNGTSQGDWFLPSAAELGYASVRMNFLNNVMTELNNTYGSSTCSTLGSHSYWSSSEYNRNYAFYFTFTYGIIRSYEAICSKESGFYVRAFYRMVP